MSQRRNSPVKALDGQVFRSGRCLSSASSAPTVRPGRELLQPCRVALLDVITWLARVGENPLGRKRSVPALSQSLRLLAVDSGHWR